METGDKSISGTEGGGWGESIGMTNAVLGSYSHIQNS